MNLSFVNYWVGNKCGSDQTCKGWHFKIFTYSVKNIFIWVARMFLGSFDNCLHRIFSIRSLLCYCLETTIFSSFLNSCSKFRPKKEPKKVSHLAL